MKYSDLIGKSIVEVKKKRASGYDDTGFLEFTFTDGTSVIVVAEFMERWTGKSMMEYPTNIFLTEKFSGLEDLPPDYDQG